MEDDIRKMIVKLAGVKNNILKTAEKALGRQTRMHEGPKHHGSWRK